MDKQFDYIKYASSGTIATITGLRTYSDIKDVRGAALYKLDPGSGYEYHCGNDTQVQKLIDATKNMR